LIKLEIKNFQAKFAFTFFNEKNIQISGLCVTSDCFRKL